MIRAATGEYLNIMPPLRISRDIWTTLRSNGMRYDLAEKTAIILTYLGTKTKRRPELPRQDRPLRRRCGHPSKTVRCLLRAQSVNTTVGSPSWSTARQRLCCLPIDLHKHLVEVPPLIASSHALDASPADLRSKHRPNRMPPLADRFVACIDSPFMQQVFEFAKRKRKTIMERFRQSDELMGPGVLEWGALNHAGRPRDRLAPAQVKFS